MTIQEGFVLILGTLEEQKQAWEKRVRAARMLRNAYRESEFANKMIAKREKEFKRRWWEAYQRCENFKKVVGQ